MDLSQEIGPIERSTLFAKWKEGKLNEATPLELLDMLGAYAYTPPRATSRAGRTVGQNHASRNEKGLDGEAKIPDFRSMEKYFS